MKRITGSVLLCAFVLGACNSGAAPSAARPSATATTAASAAPSATPAAGGLDATFGTGGILTTALSATENDRFLSATSDAAGNIFAVGWALVSGDSQMVVAKFSPDGTPDASFGTKGVAMVNVASGGKAAEVGRAVDVQSDGKIIVGGPVEHDTTATGDAARDTDVAVVRFNADGTLDASFGLEGIARVDVGEGKATSETAFTGDTSWGLGSIEGDRVVVFGTTLTKAGGDRTDSDFFLAGLTAAGELDSAFADGGLLIIDAAGGANPRHLTVQPDGKIAATGYTSIDGVVQTVIIRVSPAGELDTSFGDGGVAVTKVLDGVTESYAIALQGSSYISAGYGRGADETEKVDMVIERYDASGAWDKTFGTDGLVRLDLAKEDDRGRSVIVLPDNRILAVGSGKLDASNVDAMVYLLDENGAPVTTFGTDGHLLADLGGTADAWYGAVVSPDGQTITLVGYKGVAADSGSHDDAVIARLKL
jgi:uncharacterized delta-60 repeat protein